MYSIYLQSAVSLVATQPVGSRVVLTKKHNYLEIIIPPKGFSCGLLYVIWWAVLLNVPMVMWYCGAILSWSSGGWLPAFLALPFLVIGLNMILMILFDLFGQIRLHIDREQIALSYQLFGLRPHYTLSAPRQQIIKLERNRAIYKTDADGNAVQVKSQINIWAGTQKFEIGVDGLLSEIELDWLAHELSDWLELPISSDE